MKVARRGFLSVAAGLTSFLGMGKEAQGRLLTKTIGGASLVGVDKFGRNADVSDDPDTCDDEPEEYKAVDAEKDFIFQEQIKEALRGSKYKELYREMERLEFKIARRHASRIQGLDPDLYILNSMSLIRRIQIQQERDIEDNFKLDKLDRAINSIREGIVKRVTGQKWFSSPSFARKKTPYSKAASLLRKSR